MPSLPLLFIKRQGMVSIPVSGLNREKAVSGNSHKVVSTLTLDQVVAMCVYIYACVHCKFLRFFYVGKFVL